MNIKIYDNGGKTADRYTVIFLDFPQGKYHDMLGMSANPFHPQGFCQHGAALDGKHLGKHIKFEDLPSDCQKAINQHFEE